MSLIKAQLEKRASFLEGVRALEAAVLVASGQECSEVLFPLVIRAAKLLHSRHTSVELWRSGRRLYHTCMQAVRMSMST